MSIMHKNNLDGLNSAHNCINAVAEHPVSSIITEQWKELRAGEPGWTGFLASGIRNSYKTTPGVAACQCGSSGREAKSRKWYLNIHIYCFSPEAGRSIEDS